MSDAAPLSMKATAAAAGYSYHRFRRIWPRLVRTIALPSPLRTAADGCDYAWDAAAVSAWKDARSRALGPGRSPALDAPANDVVPSGPAFGVSPQQLARERAQLARLMATGA